MKPLYIIRIKLIQFFTN